MDEDLVELVMSEAREKMDKAISHTVSEFAAVRTGRAQGALVERLKVDAYGSEVELRQVASISVPEARLLVISPYDKALVPAIAKAVQASDLGITPTDDGQVVRLAFPVLTEERRKELVKVVRHKAEEGRVAVRNVRRAARHDLEVMQHDGELSSDELERIERDLEHLTHEHVEKIDELLAHKEKELLEN
jgi:ribosome recycling factor